MPIQICFYHVVWATKHRQPLIAAHIEPFLFRSITRKSLELKSPVLAVNGIEDHIHVAVSIAAPVSISEWVKGVKGVSAFEINKAFPDLDPRFYWQRGYTVHTFGANARNMVIDYIHRQKQHHQDATTNNYLENIESDAD